jgi:hypothetical protein
VCVLGTTGIFFGTSTAIIFSKWFIIYSSSPEKSRVMKNEKTRTSRHKYENEKLSSGDIIFTRLLFFFLVVEVLSCAAFRFCGRRPPREEFHRQEGVEFFGQHYFFY